MPDADGHTVGLGLTEIDLEKGVVIGKSGPGSQPNACDRDATGERLVEGHSVNPRGYLSRLSGAASVDKRPGVAQEREQPGGRLAGDTLGAGRTLRATRTLRPGGALWSRRARVALPSVRAHRAPWPPRSRLTTLALLIQRERGVTGRTLGARWYSLQLVIDGLYTRSDRPGLVNKRVGRHGVCATTQRENRAMLATTFA
jgi:hypothetical protein